MEIFVILSKIDPGAFANSKEFKAAAEEVHRAIEQECPTLKWRESYALLGDYDVVDVVEASSKTELLRAVEIIRTVGKASTQSFSAIPWDEHLKNM